MASSNQVLQNNLEYLSLNKIQRIGYKISHFFTNIPKKTSKAISSTPTKIRKRGIFITNIFRNIVEAFSFGDYKTRISFLVMGFGLFFKHQIIRGTLYLAYELFFIFFMIMIGGPAFSQLASLGSLAQVNYTIMDPETLLDVHTSLFVDNSFTILLYSILAILFILILVFLWYNQIRDTFNLQQKSYIGKFASDKETLKNVLDKDYDKTLLLIPMAGLTIFTIIPIFVMILIAFTDYDYLHVTPAKLFDWVGFYNLGQVFSATGANSGTAFLNVFGQVLLWTILWAFFATFSNYFFGMIVAMIINIKGIKLKKLWRTVLITTIAVPQFISLLLISFMFGDSSFSIVNSILFKLGWAESSIAWLSSTAYGAIIPKVVIILVNTWVGIPYTMLICTGLLMNIPEDLYESARIDGASPARMYFKITLPYMLFVTGPYLLSQFIGNLNNFNIIYLLSGGEPGFVYDVTNEVIPAALLSSGVGKTDLLITWIYKLTTNTSYDYGLASVLGIIVFALVAFFSMIFYNNSNAVNNEEEFQ